MNMAKDKDGCEIITPLTVGQLIEKLLTMPQHLPVGLPGGVPAHDVYVSGDEVMVDEPAGDWALAGCEDQDDDEDDGPVMHLPSAPVKFDDDEGLPPFVVRRVP
jgi:hypothetical protein